MRQPAPVSTDTRRWWRTPKTIGILLIFLFPLLLMAVGWSLRDWDNLPLPQVRPSKLPEAHWEAKRGVTMPRDDFGIATVNGKIWVLGGMTGERGNRLDTIEIYDPATDMWSSGPQMTSGRSSFRAVAIGTTIYVFGGASLETFGIDTAEALDTTTGTWRTLAPLPTGRFGHAVVELNGLIYVIGGYSGGKGIGTVNTYNPATNTWGEVASLPNPRYNLAAVVDDGKIYALGGWLNDAPSTIMEIFDPASGTWSIGPAMPKAMSNFGATVLDGRIYALHHQDHESYYPRTNRWLNATEMPTTRHGQGVATIGEAFYAIGGCYEDPQYDLNTVEAYVLGPEDEDDPFQAVGYNPAGAAALILGLLLSALLVGTAYTISRRRPRHNRDDPEDDVEEGERAGE
ncbi:MAG: kelch repeat-containing protein [Chloroflexia bacterium]